MNTPCDPVGAHEAPNARAGAHSAAHTGGGWHGAMADGVREAWNWWREAGVDVDFSDSPASWLAEVNASEAEETSPRAQLDRETPPRAAYAAENALSSPGALPPRALPKLEPIGGDAASWPQDIAGFADWWRNEPTLSPAPPERRLGPRGAMGAPWMVLVPHPEADDTETLLAGPQGRLLASMLAAMGLPAEQVYIASALPAFVAHADWAALDEAGLGAVTRHHIALAAPRRLIVLGQRILPLLGHPSTHSAAPLHKINQKSEIDLDVGVSGSIPGNVPDSNAGDSPLRIFPGLGLDNLLQRPGARAGFWRDWLNWSARGG